MTLLGAALRNPLWARRCLREGDNRSQGSLGSSSSTAGILGGCLCCSPRLVAQPHLFAFSAPGRDRAPGDAGWQCLRMGYLPLPSLRVLCHLYCPEHPHSPQAPQDTGTVPAGSSPTAPMLGDHRSKCDHLPPSGGCHLLSSPPLLPGPHLAMGLGSFLLLPGGIPATEISSTQRLPAPAVCVWFPWGCGGPRPRARASRGDQFLRNLPATSGHPGVGDMAMAMALALSECRRSPLVSQEDGAAPTAPSRSPPSQGRGPGPSGARWDGRAASLGLAGNATHCRAGFTARGSHGRSRGHSRPLGHAVF